MLSKERTLYLQFESFHVHWAHRWWSYASIECIRVGSPVCLPTNCLGWNSVGHWFFWIGDSCRVWVFAHFSFCAWEEFLFCFHVHPCVISETPILPFLSMFQPLHVDLWWVLIWIGNRFFSLLMHSPKHSDHIILRLPFYFQTDRTQPCRAGFAHSADETNAIWHVLFVEQSIQGKNMVLDGK